MLGLTLGSLYVDVQGYVPACCRICVLCLAVKLTGSWVVVGFIVGMEAYGWSLLT